MKDLPDPKAVFGARFASQTHQLTSLFDLPHPDTLGDRLSGEQKESLFQQYCPLQQVEGLPEIQLHLSFRQNQKRPLDIQRFYDSSQHCWVAYLGGVELAKWVLEHPEDFKGKRVADVGSGSGIVAIACAKVGAEVTAIDICSHAKEVIERNARANGVEKQIKVHIGNAVRFDYTKTDIIMAADVFSGGGPMLHNLLMHESEKRPLYVGAIIDSLPHNFITARRQIIDQEDGSHKGISRFLPEFDPS